MIEWLVCFISRKEDLDCDKTSLLFLKFLYIC